MPLQVTGAMQVQGTSTLLKPVVVAGGSLSLFNTWTNTGGINVTNGTLHLATPRHFGEISSSRPASFNSASARRSATPIAGVECPAVFTSNPQQRMSPPWIYKIRRLKSNIPLRLGAGTTGRITNGHIAGTLSGRTLALRSGQLSNVTLDSVRVTGSGTPAGFLAPTFGWTWVRDRHRRSRAAASMAPSLLVTTFRQPLPVLRSSAAWN